MAAAGLMPVGSAWTIPRLDGIGIEQQLWEGEQGASRLAVTLIQAGVADPSDWNASTGNAVEFLRKSLDRWVREHDGPLIQERFSLSVVLATTIDRFATADTGPDDISRMFLTVEPESAGYLTLGPTLRLLEAIHPRLPATFVHLFLGALKRWVRVYDYQDAFDRVERLREWYESDPDGESIELPDIAQSVPKCLKRRPLKGRTRAAAISAIDNRPARTLMDLAVEMDGLSCGNERPTLTETTRELLADCGEPLPTLLAVFEPNDPVEGCFDEESQGMLELTPEPNVIIELNGEETESAAAGFRALSALCAVLACASRVMRLMPGNE